MKSYERPRVWLATHEPFTPDNFMLTPKLSLRRNNVHNYYQNAIDKAFLGGSDSAGVEVPRISGATTADE